MGNPADALAQANALAAAELKVAAEEARAKLLAGGDIEPDQVVKLEGAAARAERKLGIVHRAPEVRGMTLGEVSRQVPSSLPENSIGVVVPPANDKRTNNCGNPVALDRSQYRGLRHLCHRRGLAQ